MTRFPISQDSRAILLGSSSFTDPRLSSIPAVSRNIREFRRLLISPYGSCLPAPNCSTLDDIDTVSSFGLALEAETAACQDLFLLYFAGHGLIDDQGALHLAIRSTNLQYPHWTAIPYALVRRTVSRSPARNRIVILDCCFSGRALDAMSDETSALLGQLEIAGAITLTSAPANSPSFAPQGETFTAFSGILFSLLGRGIPDGTTVLTLAALFTELQQRMARQGLPQPQRMGSGNVELLALALNNWSTTPAPDTLDQRGLLAQRLREALDRGHRGDWGSARALLERLVADFARPLGETTPVSLMAREALAHATGQAGDTRLAIQMYRTLVDDHSERFGTEDHNTLAVLDGLAHWLGSSGDTDEALKVLNQLYDSRLRKLGRHHPDALGVRWQIARLHGLSGRAAAAAEAFTELAKEYADAFGAAHPDVAAARNNATYWSGPSTSAPDSPSPEDPCL
ncbi:caspase, EACC1-associated type [Kineosporia babensis]|uniref:Tetratricopeptide repeat protein n=1 Tax=Kineosporia babensis TaxID=499548 RepID=A0A9X1NM47_9ACTN|nr:caspase family protein [Kineosporia babensis]MCD5316099.1 tetratricopeptide repeat protein [Kineosporia babensis]